MNDTERKERIIYLEKEFMTQEQKDIMNDLWRTKDIKIYNCDTINFIYVSAESRKADDIIDKYWPKKLCIGNNDDFYLGNVQFDNLSRMNETLAKHYFSKYFVFWMLFEYDDEDYEPTYQEIISVDINKDDNIINLKVLESNMVYDDEWEPILHLI